MVKDTAALPAADFVVAASVAVAFMAVAFAAVGDPLS
jgi:hypothetical protein